MLLTVSIVNVAHTHLNALKTNENDHNKTFAVEMMRSKNKTHKKSGEKKKKEDNTPAASEPTRKIRAADRIA